MDLIQKLILVKYNPADNYNLNRNIQVQVGLQHQYYNLSNFPIGIGFRDGKKFCINRHINTNESGFARQPGIYICQPETYCPEAKRAIASLSYQDNEAASESLKMAIEEFTRKPSSPYIANMPNSSHGNIYITGYFPESYFKEGKEYYCHELDAVFVRLPNHFDPRQINTLVPDHPYSFKEKTNEFLHYLQQPKTHSEQKRLFTQEFKLVVGVEWSYNELYLREIGPDGQLLVDVIVGESLFNVEPGLYVIKTKNGKQTVRHLKTPAEFEEFSIFVSQIQALTPTPIMLAKLEADRKVIQLKHDDLKQKDQIRQLEIASQLASDKHAHEIRSLQLKNEYLDKERIKHDNESAQKEREAYQKEQEREREYLFNEKKHQRDIKQLIAENLLLREKRLYEENKESKDRFGSVLKWFGELLKSLGGLLTGLLGLVAIALKVLSKAPVPIV